MVSPGRIGPQLLGDKSPCRPSKLMFMVRDLGKFHAWDIHKGNHHVPHGEQQQEGHLHLPFAGFLPLLAHFVGSS